MNGDAKSVMTLVPGIKMCTDVPPSFTPHNGFYVVLILNSKARALPVVELAFVVHFGGGDVAMAHARLHGFNRALPVERLRDEGRPGTVWGDPDG